MSTLAADRARYRRPAPTLVRPALDADERVLLAMVAAGLTHRQIAARAGKSPTATQNKLSRIFRKIGAVNAPNAVAIAIRDGLISARKGAR